MLTVAENVVLDLLQYRSDFDSVETGYMSKSKLKSMLKSPKME